MKKILSLVLVLCVMTTIIFTSVLSSNAEITRNYKDEFVSAFDCESFYYDYDEYYNYYAEDNTTDTPDWVFGRAQYLAQPSPCQGIFGDYVICSSGLCEPYNLGYFVYVPSENKFYDIIEAWELGFENLEYAFDSSVKNGSEEIGLIGDIDLDGEVSVIDAAFIQKVQAELCEYPLTDRLEGRCIYGDALWYLSDFNRDGERNILDATTIQKKLAKIEI